MKVGDFRMPGIKVKEHESFDEAYRRFKKQCDRNLIVTETRARRFFEPMTEIRKKQKINATEFDVVKKFDELEKEFDDAGSKLEVITDDQVRSGYLIPNLKKLYMYLSMARPDESTIETIVSCVESHMKITLKELREALELKGIGMRPVWYCLAHKIILTNLEKYISNRSILWSQNHAV